MNSLAYCAQEVLAAAEEMKEAEVGSARSEKPEAGFAPAEISAYLERSAAAIEAAIAGLPHGSLALAREGAKSLRELAASCVARVSDPRTRVEGPGHTRAFWLAAERVPAFRSIYPDAQFDSEPAAIGHEPSTDCVSIRKSCACLMTASSGLNPA